MLHLTIAGQPASREFFQPVLLPCPANKGKREKHLHG
jgi:hypothetical protein